MPTIRRILVAVKDPSARSQPGVLKAAQVAQACGASVEIFHTLTTPVYADLVRYTGDGVAGLEEKLRQQALLALEKIAQRLRKHELKVAVSAEWDFPAHEAVIRRALQIKADLIVVSRHEGRHILPWLLRLTDWELVRHSPVPVLLVKSNRPYRHPAILVAVDPTHQFAKPLRLDKKLLNMGSYISQKMRGTLHAVHAYSRIPIALMPSYGLSPEILERVGKKAEQTATRLFKGMLQSSNIAPSRRHLVSAHPISAIPAVARKTGSALVVMGAVSRRGLKNLLIGNTAEQILDELACDVLVVKPATFQNKVSRTVRGAQLRISSPAGDLGWY
jgi:universal stress protein E